MALSGSKLPSKMRIELKRFFVSAAVLAGFPCLTQESQLNSRDTFVAEGIPPESVFHGRARPDGAADPSVEAECGGRGRKLLQPNWVAGPVLLVVPSLLSRMCADVEVSRMTLVPEADREPVPQLRLTSQKPVYIAGEAFAIQVSAAPGEPSVDDGNCPTLYERERSPDGTTSVDQVRPLAFKGCEESFLGHMRGDWAGGFEVDLGSPGRWHGSGNN